MTEILILYVTGFTLLAVSLVIALRTIRRLRRQLSELTDEVIELRVAIIRLRFDGLVRKPIKPSNGSPEP